MYLGLSLWQGSKREDSILTARPSVLVGTRSVGARVVSTHMGDFPNLPALVKPVVHCHPRALLTIKTVADDNQECIGMM